MQDKPKRRGIPFLQKIFFLAVILFVFGGIGLWYVNEYIMPTRGKTLIVETLTKATGREVTLGNVYYNPLRGVVLHNLSVSDEARYDRKFLEVKKAYLNILYLPLIKERKLVVSSVRIDSPKVVLTIDDQNKWNFASLAFLNQPQAARQPNVLVNSVIISGATIDLEDLAVQPAFKKRLKDTDITTWLSFPLKVKYRFNSGLDIPRKNSVSAEGEFDFAKKSLTLNLRLKNMPLDEFRQYYEGLPFTSLAGNLSGNISAALIQDKGLTVVAVASVSNIDLQKTDLWAKGAADLSGKMTLDFKDSTKTKIPCVLTAAAKISKLDLTSKDYSVQGAVDLNGRFAFDAKDKTVPLKYSADAQLLDTKVSGVPYFASVEQINGKVYFNEAKLWTDLLKGSAMGFELVFSGNIKDYPNPYIDLSAKTDVDLSKLDQILTPELKEKLKELTLSGLAKTSLRVTGLLNQQDKVPLAYEVAAELDDCAVQTAFLPKAIDPINGNIAYKADSLTLRNVSGFYDNKKYLLSGEITNLKTPACDLSFSSDDLKIKALFKYLENKLAFSRFDGRYKNTVFNLAGSLTDFKAPSLGINGTVLTDAAELMQYMPKDAANFLKKLDPATAISAAFEFTGKQKEPRTWNISFSKLEAKSKAADLSVFGAFANPDDPSLDLRGSLVTTVGELTRFLTPQQADMLAKNNVGGDFSAKFVFKGKQKDTNTWQIDLIADSPRLKVKTLNFDNCHLEGTFKQKYLTVSHLTANPYDGELAASAVIDMSQENPQYVVQIGVRDIDIGRWKLDTAMKDKDLRGRFSANAELGGYGQDLGTMKGKGNFRIDNGRFWELPVFSGLANILYIPGVSNIVFGQAQGTFTIANKKIYTDDTQLASPQMNLTGNGNVDFDGNMNFQVTAVFDKALLQVPTSLGPLRDIFIDNEGRYLGDITVDGTTKEPKFKVNPVPINKIFQNKLFENIKKGIFGGSSE